MDKYYYRLMISIIDRQVHIATRIVILIYEAKITSAIRNLNGFRN